LEPRDVYVKVRDFRMHYVDWGDNGPAVILYHGGQRTGRSWDAVARRLQSQYHVIGLDGRGHGDSEWTPRGYAMDSRVKDLIAFLETTGLVGATVAGHSIGGTASIFAALARPDVFGKLAPVDPMITTDVETSLKRARNETDTRRYWPSREDFEATLRWHRTTSIWADEVIRDIVRNELVAHPSGQVEAKWAPQSFNYEERASDAYDLFPDLPRLKVPVLLMLAKDHTPEEFARAEAAFRQMPRGHLAVFANAGHNIYMERPEDTANLLRDFLLGHPVPSCVGEDARAARRDA